MAIEKVLGSYARAAGEDLTGKLHYIAHIDTDGDIVLAGDGEQPCGVITEEATAGNGASVQFLGIGKVIAGGSVTAGQNVASDTNGKGVAATSNEDVLGIALESASANEIFPVLLCISPTP